MVKPQRKKLIFLVSIIALLVLGAFYFINRQRSSLADQSTPLEPTSVPLPVNLLPVAKRPFVTLEPLPGRNELQLTIHNLPEPADSVEVTLEYDRNKGVLDAVLKQFPLTNLPLIETLFLGSKSAGGATTYHDDVIGGSMTLKFKGSNPYTLKVPWRYSDTQKSYAQLSTTDAFFQVDLEKPITQTKVIVMQSPGAPEALPGELIAGPYLIRTVGPLPVTTATVALRLPSESPSATLYGWDETNWLKLEATIEGKTVKYSGPLYSVYAVTQ